MSDAVAQDLTKQWPSVPSPATAHHNDDVDLIPRPVIPPTSEPPGSDPLLSTADPSLGIKGTLVYLARGWDGGQAPPYTDLVLRSLGGKRLLPARHLGPPSVDLHSEGATYGFHEGEYGSGNPQFSPDGHVLLYDQIQPMARYGECSVYEWDMVAGQVRQLTPSTLAYLDVFWAPDSQSLAYVNGGWDTGKPAQLCVVDRRTYHTQTVGLPEGVSLLFDSPAPQQMSFTPIAWDSSTRVLLTGVEKSKAGASTSARPNIYEAMNGEAHMLVPQAYGPSASPDGRWIACFGWPQPQAAELKQQPPQSGPNIYLYDSQQRKRFFVRALSKYGRREEENGSVAPLTVLQWMPDSRRLIIMETTSWHKQDAGEATATIATLDVPTIPSPGTAQWAQALHPVTTLHMPDSSDFPTVHFAPLRMSQDEKYLFVGTQQTTGRKGDKTTSESSLQRVNLSTGQADVLARFNPERLLGFDWHDEP